MAGVRLRERMLISFSMAGQALITIIQHQRMHLQNRNVSQVPIKNALTDIRRSSLCQRANSKCSTYRCNVANVFARWHCDVWRFYLHTVFSDLILCVEEQTQNAVNIIARLPMSLQYGIAMFGGCNCIMISTTSLIRNPYICKITTLQVACSCADSRSLTDIVNANYTTSGKSIGDRIPKAT